MDNTSEKILKHKDSLNITFGKFKNDLDHIKDDIKHCYKKCCLKCFLNRLCCFLG